MYEYLSTSIYNWIGYLWTGGVNNVNNITSNSEVSTSKDNPFLGIYNHFLLETEMLERSDVLKILSQNKNYQILQISIPKYYSSYLFCQIVFDILDILSNELFFVQTQIQFVFDTETSGLPPEMSGKNWEERDAKSKQLLSISFLEKSVIFEFQLIFRLVCDKYFYSWGKLFIIDV